MVYNNSTTKYAQILLLDHTCFQKTFYYQFDLHKTTHVWKFIYSPLEKAERRCYARVRYKIFVTKVQSQGPGRPLHTNVQSQVWYHVVIKVPQKTHMWKKHILISKGFFIMKAFEGKYEVWRSRESLKSQILGITTYGLHYLTKNSCQSCKRFTD